MKKILLILFLCCNTMFAYGATLPAGTNIEFELAEPISSESIQPMQKIKIIALEDIKMQNQTFFKKGAEGYIIVRKSLPARKFSKQGEIEFGNIKYYEKSINISSVSLGSGTVNYGGKYYSDGFIEDTKGNMCPIKFNRKLEGNRNMALKITANAMIWNPIGWLLGLKKGEEVVLPVGTKFYAIIPMNISF